MIVTLKLSKNQAHKRLLPVKGNKKYPKKFYKMPPPPKKKSPAAGFSLGWWPTSNKPIFLGGLG